MFLSVLLHPAYASVSLSTTQVGATARLTAFIPSDPCGTFKLGETRTRTIEGFYVSVGSVMNYQGGANYYVDGNVVRVNLRDAIVTQFLINNSPVSFHVQPIPPNCLNCEDFLSQGRQFDLESPREFTPQDTASIIVDNIKIVDAGKVRVGFSLIEPTGVYCLHSGTNILDVGVAQASVPPQQSQSDVTQAESVQRKPTNSFNISPTQTVISSTPTPSQQVEERKTTVDEKKPESPLKSLFETIASFLFRLFKK